MQRLDKSQKEKVAQFQSISGTSVATAIHCLQASNWTSELALDIFFSNDFPEVAEEEPAVDERAIARLFKKYKDKQQDAILAEGIQQFCDDLGVDPADIVMLVISWHLSAAAMGEYSSAEFEQGMCSMRCSTIEDLRRHLPNLRSELKDDQTYREVYNYAYDFSREPGQKCVQLETALAMWQLVFSVRPWKLLPAWCSFLSEHHRRAISKDTWVQLLDFAWTIKPDLSNFKDDALSAWPTLVDDFVDHQRQHAAANQQQSNNAEVIELDDT
ncbi:hypothetical protein WJX84_011561 [Apatococcus fuscideae]|uniref:Defective in cullin neddylation protein n=1 Tax=Apatococcus fuscideae TaxID=2026836 RepID=A0AAW1TEI0_9CHLO